jgi:hypothetical protein
MKDDTLACRYCKGPIDACADVSTCSTVFETFQRLERRVELLSDYLRDAGYRYCEDESGEFWVKEK